MATNVIDLDCPGCGAPVNTGTEVCEFCKRPIVISTFNSVANMSMPELNKYASSYKKALAGNPDDSSLNSSIAMCYLKLSLYDQATAAFEQAIAQDFDNSELYFYNAICLLKGKKAFKALRPAIDKIEELLAAAVSVEPRGIYYYLHAYVKNDYYERKHYNTSPTCQELVDQATTAGIHTNDAQQLFKILKVDMPATMEISG